MKKLRFALFLSLALILSGLFLGLLLVAKRRPFVVSLAGLVCIADVFAVNRGVNPAGPPEVLSLRPRVLATLPPAETIRVYVYNYQSRQRSRAYLGRDYPYVAQRVPAGWNAAEANALAMRNYLFPPSSAAFGIRGSYDLDFVDLYPSYLNTLTYLARTSEGSPLHLRLLRMGAVTHVLALHSRGFEELEKVAEVPDLFPEPIRVYSVPRTLPRAYVVDGVRVASGAAAIDTLADPTFDISREIILPSGQATRSSRPVAGTAREIECRGDHVLIEADLPFTSGYVVLADTFDRGWTARVDGKEAPVLRANLAFRAVSVERGFHRIEMRYCPPGLLLGGGLALLALAASLLLARTPVLLVEKPVEAGQLTEVRGVVHEPVAPVAPAFDERRSRVALEAVGDEPVRPLRRQLDE